MRVGRFTLHIDPVMGQGVICKFSLSAHYTMFIYLLACWNITPNAAEICQNRAAILAYGMTKTHVLMAIFGDVGIQKKLKGSHRNQSVYAEVATA